MAQIVLPLLALGSLYILSNKDDFSEGDTQIGTETFTNLEDDSNLVTSNKSPPQCIQNHSIDQKTDVSSMKKYDNPNAYQNKYFGQSQGASIQSPAPSQLASPFCDEQVSEEFASISGKAMSSDRFSHNNMVPFFGSKMSGANINDSGVHETILDNMQGSGSQLIEKKEVGSFFSPENNVQHINGAPNVNDFLQSRVNPSIRVANVKPWEEERVGPGLNQGFTTNGAGGYNSYLEQRDSFLPKNVDQMRTSNNPKPSYTLQNHEGPLMNPIKNIGVMGKMEKQMPDTYYENGSERWLTTTGAYTGSTMHANNDHNVSETKGLNSREHFGVNGNANGEVSYIPRTYEESTKISLPIKPFINLIGTDKKSGNSGDFGHTTHSFLENNRTTTNSTTLGNAYGANSVLGAVVNPIINMLKPTRKTNVIGNVRESGNVNSGQNAAPVYHQNKLAVTNREMVETNEFNHLNYNQHTDGTYQANGYQPVVNNRDTTTGQALGNPGGGTSLGVKPYNAAYAQRNNSIKTVEGRTNMGNMSLYNPYENVNIKNNNDTDLCNQRTVIPQQMPFATASASTLGEISRDPQPYQNINDDRMAPDLLTAFKNNPYTHSLASAS